jgi:hypothetical protein
LALALATLLLTIRASRSAANVNWEGERERRVGRVRVDCTFVIDAVGLERPAGKSEGHGRRAREEEEREGMIAGRG